MRLTEDKLINLILDAIRDVLLNNKVKVVLANKVLRKFNLRICLIPKEARVNNKRKIRK